MRQLIFDDDQRHRFQPLSLSRPVWELRCGIDSLAEKIARRIGRIDGYFTADYLAPTTAQRSPAPVNDPALLRDDDLLLVNGRVDAYTLDLPGGGGSVMGVRGEDIVFARILRTDLQRLPATGLAGLLAAARQALPAVQSQARLFDFIWDVMLESPHMIERDFRALGRSGVEGTIEEPSALRGSKKDVYIAPGCRIHPMVVIDASAGPVFLDEGVEVHPFTRIEGPAYVGKKSILLGTKLREGCSIGPVCRVGGEVEESVIHGYSNKYHDGFLGHAYVGQWVNLGALTTNSDLKNDYGAVEVTLAGKTYDTGSTKVGSMIGDHVKTSIGTLLNTGCVIGSMSLILTDGKPLPKSLPCFSWFLEDVVTKGFGRKKLYETAKTAMGRRKLEWTAQEEALWEHVFELTKPERDEAIKKGRRKLAGLA